MTNDERAIRDLVAAWMAASRAGDTETVLGLMADDVVFMVPGQAPFGKAAFAAASKGQADFEIDGTSDILELEVLGDWAYLRNHLTVTMTPKAGTPKAGTPKAGGKPMRRSGDTLTILRKTADGRWLLARDANLMTPESA